jgi:hypothetical protein
MISSGLYLFLGISVLLDAKRHTSSRTTSTGVAPLSLVLIGRQLKRRIVHLLAVLAAL